MMRLAKCISRSAMPERFHQGRPSAGRRESPCTLTSNGRRIILLSKRLMRAGDGPGAFCALSRMPAASSQGAGHQGGAMVDDVLREAGRGLSILKGPICAEGSMPPAVLTCAIACAKVLAKRSRGRVGY